MKTIPLSRVSVFIAIAMLAACSKDPSQRLTKRPESDVLGDSENRTPLGGEKAVPNDTKNASEAQRSESANSGAIKLVNLYLLQLGNYGGWLAAEYENAGTTGVIAFKGKCSIYDDFGEVLIDQDVRYTSDTLFQATDNQSAQHIIQPGERFFIVDIPNRPDAGEVSSEFTATKDKALQVFSIYFPGFKGTNLDLFLVKKKHKFEPDKIVTQ